MYSVAIRTNVWYNEINKTEEDTTMTDNEKRAKALEEIANDILGIDTLRTQSNDSLDFHEVSVWSLKAALEAAYRLGRDSR